MELFVVDAWRRITIQNGTREGGVQAGLETGRRHLKLKMM